jgi:chemotaxis response regulator CheB
MAIAIGEAMSPHLRRHLPILVAADDDWEALGRMLEFMADYEVISVKNWPKLKDAVERFEPDLVLLADTLRSPRMTAENMVARLFTEFRSRIVILSDSISHDQTAWWRERGAVDCLLHPTKVRGRMLTLLGKVRDLVILRKAETGRELEGA